MSEKLPLISIITVVFNGETTLRRTIVSVANQSYAHIEYIIIDGASTDGTLDVVSDYKEVVTKIISEPDSGLYDAMNKGLEIATGSFVWFINSGDEIASPNTLSHIFENNHPIGDIYYGDTMIVDDQGVEIGKRRLQPPDQLTWKDFKRGMIVSHQSVIIRKSICRPYQLKYRFSADFDWVLYALKNSRLTINTHLTLSKFLDGGLTKNNIVAGLKERFRIMTNNFGLLSTLAHHIPISLKFIVFIVKYKRF